MSLSAITVYTGAKSSFKKQLKPAIQEIYLPLFQLKCTLFHLFLRIYRINCLVYRVSYVELSIVKSSHRPGKSMDKDLNW